MPVAIYLRVSQDGQTEDNQRLQLLAVGKRLGWTDIKEYVDHGISGAKGRQGRPAFDQLCRAITRKEFDLVAAWSVDRLGRSLPDLVAFLSELHAKGIGLYLHQQGLDTTTPAGRMLFQMMGVFAEYERAMIVERVKCGLARARALGVRLGRPAVTVNPDEVARLRENGLTWPEIAKQLHISVSSAKRLLKRRLVVDAEVRQ